MKEQDRKFKAQENVRVLAQNIYVSNNTRETMLNNNDIVIGPSGCGKTGGYVIPNIRMNQGSMVVADTKGQLCRMLTPELERAGYQVKTLDFVRMEKSCRYNPLDYIRRGDEPGSYRQQDVFTIADAVVPVMDRNEPFWENSAKSLIVCLIAYVIEALPEEEQNLESVMRLAKIVNDKRSGASAGKDTVFGRLFEELAAENPDSFAVRRYDSLKISRDAERMWASIHQFVSEALKVFDFRETRHLCADADPFRIQDLARRKTVLFVNVSDTDRTFDRLVNIFYTQLFQVLCAEADNAPDGRLRVPVRVILDDFATNVRIPDFEKLISVIRSREISVSLILQSITQLNTMYTPEQSMTIINNCDHLLYLGGQDVETARYIGAKANRTADSILNMGLSEAYLFSRGEEPRKVRKIRPYSRIGLPCGPEGPEQEEEAAPLLRK